MARNRLLLAVLAVPICLASILLASADQTRTAVASGVLDPTCTSSSPCIEYDNTGTGQGMKGVSTQGNGLTGWTQWNSTSSLNAKYGVVGNDQSASGTFDAGVLGKSVRGTGVSGTSTNGAGLSGVSTTNYGVLGITTSGYAVAASSTNGFAVYGQSGYLGVYGTAPNYGVYGTSPTGYGVDGNSSSGVGVYATSGGSTGRAFEGHTSGGVGILATNTAGNGADVAGSYIGVVARSDTFPLFLTNSTGGSLFYVDGSGNVYYHGTFHNFAVTRAGTIAKTYIARTTSPVVEDTGSAQLINGAAMVALDPAFAQTIDPRVSYHVMLTPDGDTRGLFVASKGAAGFVVREVQGGRSSLSFDYHIYATAFGHAGEHMVVMTPAAAAAMSPRAPILTGRAIMKPQTPQVKPIPVPLAR